MKSLMLFLGFLFPLVLQAQTILFVRGGNGTVAWMEGWANDEVADITDTSTSGGNHGWGTLAADLRGLGYTTEEVKEGDANHVAGSPVSFETMNLSKYACIVFGSNNAVYGSAAVDTIEHYVRNGGAALFISDANFGVNWASAPTSDQFFLNRFGWTMNQDNGKYPASRGAGDFLVPNHPILSGVNSFDGEGVSPITLSNNSVSGVTSTVVARANYTINENNNSSGGQGTSRPPTLNDAALIVATAGKGRIAGSYDRNTFFNKNGAGTSIKNLDNETYARNLFTWLVAGQRPTQQYTITASAGANGTISPSDSVVVDSGSSQSFAIGASSGYSISQVTVDGANQGALSSYTFTNVTANHTISATFTSCGSGDSDLTNAYSGTITARGENSGGGEGKEMAFDNNFTSTKWYDDGSAATWIQYQFNNGVMGKLTSYTLTSANDMPTRDPKDWTLKASNDGANWTTVDTRSNEMFANRLQKETFCVSMSSGYNYYRLDITANNGAASTQLEEIELCGTRVLVTGLDGGPKLMQRSNAPEIGIKIYSLAGKLVANFKTKTSFTDIGNPGFQWPALKRGSYIYSAELGKGRVVSGKVTINLSSKGAI